MDARKTGSTTVLVLAALLAWLPAKAEAQQQFFVEGRGGIGIGIADMGALTDPGPTFGLELGYWLNDRLAVTVGGDATFLGGADRDLSDAAAEDENRVFTDVPDMRLFQYMAGLQVLVTPPENPFEVRLGGAVGASTIQSDAFSASFLNSLPGDVEVPADGEFSQTQLTFQPNLSVGYQASPRFTVFAATRPYVALMHAEETEFLGRAAEDADPQGFDTAWNVPLQAGVKIGF